MHSMPYKTERAENTGECGYVYRFGSAGRHAHSEPWAWHPFPELLKLERAKGRRVAQDACRQG
jgi:hypothetical protein